MLEYKKLKCSFLLCFAQFGPETYASILIVKFNNSLIDKINRVILFIR